jgi:hypothetical protein
MEMELKNLSMETNIEVTMKMANLQGMDNIFGAMEAFSKEILLMA